MNIIEKLGIHPSNVMFFCNECGKDDSCVLIVNSSDYPENCIHGFQDKAGRDGSNWEEMKGLLND